MDLIDYFRNSWKPNYDKFKYSGWKLLDKIEPHHHVLDIGCGYNLFKPHLQPGQMLGIDPANDAADIVVSIENFDSIYGWDVILCLGSLNFGTQEVVEAQVEKAVSLLKPGGRIFWRQNPGIGDHPWKGVEEIEFFPWTIELNYEWAKKYECKVIECKWDNGDRIYAEWKKQ